MPNRFEKVHSFSVPADRMQVERWREAAAWEGKGVETWLADTADTCLKELARTGKRPPLSWWKTSFRVAFVDGEREVRGAVSDYFAVFRGNHRGVGEPGCGIYSLVHRPSQRIVKTLSLKKACMALASELSTLNVNWRESDPEKVLGEAPDKAKAQQLIRLFDTLTD
ncbi:MAG TPA: hypothetical protein VF173_12425 [Thermoanaerobaculia bacterium]|nr:hypothetical protein [Thermoanaerobaculia bacterium]